MRCCIERAKSPAQRLCHPGVARDAVLVSHGPSCYVPANSAKYTHCAWHMTGRSDQEPTLARRWVNALPCFTAFSVSVVRCALGLKSLPIKAERSRRVWEYIAVGAAEE